VVVDAGANIGNHAIYLAKFCDVAKIHAFEPMPHARAILERNTALNAPDLIDIHPVALGASESKATVRLFSPANHGSTTLEEDPNGQIPIQPLDAFALPQVDLIKIDVEGMQDAVLEGAQDTIARSKPAMIIEAFDRDDERVKTERVLDSLGYAVDDVIGHNLWALPK